jgi:hypothetical protein
MATDRGESTPNRTHSHAKKQKAHSAIITCSGEIRRSVEIEQNRAAAAQSFSVTITM